MNIKDAVNEFVKDKKPFTSVDISNFIKVSGEWVSNRFVSRELNDLYSAGEIEDYKKDFITVVRTEDGVNVKAILYFYSDIDLNCYKNTSNKSISPDEFNFNYAVLDLNDGVDLDMNTQVLDDDKKNDGDTVKGKQKKFTKSKRNFKKFNFL